MSGWHYLDLEEAIMINCQLRQADGTVYNVPRNRRFCNICKNNIGDKCHYLWSVQSWKNIEKSVYHQCILNDQILKIIFIKKISCHY